MADKVDFKVPLYLTVTRDVMKLASVFYFTSSVSIHANYSKQYSHLNLSELTFIYDVTKYFLNFS